VFAVLGVAARKELLRLVRSFRVKESLLGFGFLFLWTLLILATIRVYSGAQWTGDWLEHFQRTLFFLDRLPANTVFTDVYTLPGRPPFMNVVAVFFLAQTQDRFELFQIVFTFLNLLFFLPCCLILKEVAGARRTRILPMVVLFALNPLVIQNATYSWTKSLTVFFVILGLALYLAARRKNDTFRMVAAFVSVAAAILVHYSAGAYVVVLTAHYLLSTFWKRPQKWKELATIATVCSLFLATYFGWAFSVYGDSAIRSISTISPNQTNQGSHLVRVGLNLVDTFIPYLVRDYSLMKPNEQPNSFGWFRDVVFLVYEPNVILGMGMIGGPIICWLLYRRLRRKSKTQWDDGRFWVAFVLFSLLVGAATIGGREPLGLANGYLLTLQVIGLTLLASFITRRRMLTTLVLVGCILDFSIGILLHAQVQSHENVDGKTFFSDLVYLDGSIRHAPAGPDTLSDSAWQNWFVKHQRALCDRWLKEMPEKYGNEPGFPIVWPGYRFQIENLRKQDDAQWGGWYSRHGGEVGFLGDQVVGAVGEKLPLFVLTVLLVGLISLNVKQTPNPEPLKPKSKVPPKPRAKVRA
jgi:hypothetical protein